MIFILQNNAGLWVPLFWIRVLHMYHSCTLAYVNTSKNEFTSCCMLCKLRENEFTSLLHVSCCTELTQLAVHTYLSRGTHTYLQHVTCTLQLNDTVTISMRSTNRLCTVLCDMINVTIGVNDSSFNSIALSHGSLRFVPSAVKLQMRRNEEDQRWSSLSPMTPW